MGSRRGVFIDERQRQDDFLEVRILTVDDAI